MAVEVWFCLLLTVREMEVIACGRMYSTKLAVMDCYTGFLNSKRKYHLEHVSIDERIILLWNL